MPNQAVLASAGVVAISMAIAAAIAVYESPELRRLADDLRRKVAIALQALGENISPDDRPPLFNRPEDAEGFLASQGNLGDVGVVADDETRRRQREELLYWNAIHLEKQARELREKAEAEAAAKRGSGENPRGPTFDDLLSQDKDADRGTYVINTGASIRRNDDGLVQRRPYDGVRGLNTSVLSNPFADEYQISDDMQSSAMIAPTRDELPAPQPIPASQTIWDVASDLYDDIPTPKRRLSDAAPAPVSLPVFDAPAEAPEQTPEPSTRSVTLERELAEDEYMTAGQDDRNEAYSNIQAWAQPSNPGFYSPLPETPDNISEPEVLSMGMLTPTDSVSVVDAAEVAAINEESARAGNDLDVISESDDGMATPASWSEVGSVISEDDHMSVRA